MKGLEILQRQRAVEVSMLGVSERLEQLHQIKLRMLAGADFLRPHGALQQVTKELSEVMLQQGAGGHRHTLAPGSGAGPDLTNPRTTIIFTEHPKESKTNF